jgi:hypothetical protein
LGDEIFKKLDENDHVLIKTIEESKELGVYTTIEHDKKKGIIQFKINIYQLFIIYECIDLIRELVTINYESIYHVDETGFNAYDYARILGNKDILKIFDDEKKIFDDEKKRLMEQENRDLKNENEKMMKMVKNIN